MRALHDITFAVPTGSVCALLGHNGAGKTTTVNILSTLLRPSTGHALVGGHDVVRDADKVRAAISVTGQDASVDLLLTGRENLILFSRLRGLSRRDARKRADEMIERFDLAKAADRQVMTYSGGMRRRIDIAASLVVTPQVLFLDEPTTGLDPRSRRDVWSLVSELRDQGVTVLLTTQYLEEADVLSDSIIILNGGEIIASGTAEQLKRHLGFAYCQVTPVSPDDLSAVATALADYEGLEIDTDLNTVSLPAANGVATLGEVFRRIEGLGVELLDISLRKPSLDEVFLHLTERPVTA
ncbi:daunorubicin resistance protein DrrA family ABC transporter ATP-binding protein [Mycolicibacterium murale]|jgi:ABC-2 type transport system ATP-binding protein|uniref:Daunorubicin resistance ABC transporter ATP-binding subunit n=3 Tax=Mycobacteriaceae TaxID=1762 RepID=A0A378T7H7_9MYCO|nr:ATP-binding cassette domain-containing protein [Mycolicibacterium murale]BBY88707.1 daunorubicin resistance protein DrrA family ABC transporter ATP-binding protein [Mycolicibacterium tokaiense]GFG59975.1 daunorubicin resistance protein DrrA family ABC transporter ATP-binding protein [Mycolicibacterium murale]STZ56768.1 daunorubicin resistance ABC transporter ATP-binding subunit [Mycolicibacterium tokaiense]